MSDAIAGFDIVHLDGHGPHSRTEEVAHEEPLELRVDGVPLAVLMRTPGHDEELARGFLLTERVVSSLTEVVSVRHCTTSPTPESDENVMLVRLREDVRFDLERFRRHTYASSSCGVCGKATIENAAALAEPVTAKTTISRDALRGAPDALRAAQPAFAATGGLHAAGLFDRSGALLLAREDVGRHNAVDKAIGAAAATGLALEEVALVVSGRVSFELVQKAAAARVPILAGISAPTSLAVRAARSLGLTLIGFLRGEAMNVYSGVQRIEP